MKFGSVCSGIEAASVAWEPLGWKAAWLSEIEPFPSAVLAHHYPDVPNLGDMTTLPDRISSGEVEAPDLFCGGTPCQAFSVAGTRKSLDDERGNLSLTFCEIANAIDARRAGNAQQPAIIFWENVPGVLSTKDNAFGCFLAGLAGEDDALVPPREKWENAGYVLGPKRAIAWRVLDAQYFGLAQRRRRVFVVASARDNFDPATVLFEFEGLRRDIAPSREKEQGFARVAGTLTSNCGGLNRPAGNANELDFCIPATFDRQSSGEYGTAPVASTVAARDYKCASDLVAQPMPINTMIALRHEALGERTGFGIGDAGDPSFTLTKGHSHAVAQPMIVHGTQDPCVSDIAFAQGRNNGGENVLQTGMAVRRLTPIECERLQGFPDGYTNIPWRNKPASDCPDGPRYKALGNSWAVPVVRWIGQRIQLSVEITKHKEKQ